VQHSGKSHGLPRGHSNAPSAPGGPTRDAPPGREGPRSEGTEKERIICKPVGQRGISRHGTARHGTALLHRTGIPSTPQSYFQRVKHTARPMPRARDLLFLPYRARSVVQSGDLCTTGRREAEVRGGARCGFGAERSACGQRWGRSGAGALPRESRTAALRAGGGRARSIGRGAAGSPAGPFGHHREANGSRGGAPPGQRLRERRAEERRGRRSCPAGLRAATC